MTRTAKHDWPMVRLGEVCEISIGKTPARKNPEYWGEGHPWLSIRDMNQGPSLSDTAEQITDLAVRETSPRLCEPGTVLFSFKLSIGKVGIAEIPLYTNEAIAAFVPLEAETLLSEYLFHALQFFGAKLEGQRAVMGQTLNKASLSRIAIPLPPLDKQRRIAAILDEANGLINKLKKQLGLLERQDVKVVEKFLTSTNYSFKALSEVCEVNPITRFPTGISEKIPFIPMGAVSESGVLTFTEWRRMDEVRSGYTRFRKNDVLVAKIAPCYENGKSAIATIDEDFAAGSTEFHVFRCDANLDPRFLHAVLNSTVVRTTGIANMRGSSGHRRVPAWVFANLKIPVPPIEIQKELMDAVDEGIERKRRSVQKQLRSSIELSQSLSTRAFQGEL